MEGAQAPEGSARWLFPNAQVPEPDQPRRVDDACSVVDTAELRWFVPGPRPPKVRFWFTGSTGVPEERCDAYLLDGRVDTSVKRRFRETLELKVRQSLDARVELDEGLAGSLEVWRKWSPAEGLVEDDTDGWWVDVHKSVVKRRFCLDGTEIAFSSDRAQPVRAATSRSPESRLVPSGRGHSRSRRSARPPPDGTLCSPRGKR